MSIKIMSWVFDHSPYEGKSQMIHMALADHADDDGRCWPGNDRVAKKARATTEYVRVIVNDMIARGLVEELEVGGGRGRTKHLRLLGPWNETPNSVAPTGLPQPEKPPTPAAETPNSEPTLSSYRNHQESPTRERVREHDFDAFWAAYPSKVGKDAARKAWGHRVRSGSLPSVEELLDAVKRYMDTDTVKRGFVVHPATWLNQGRWQDETVSAPTEKWVEW